MWIPVQLTSKPRPWFAAVLLLVACVMQVWAETPPATTTGVPKLQVVGGLASVNQYVRSEEPFWTQELSRLSAGKYSADISPFDRSGVPGEEMLRLMELGVVPFGTALMGLSSSQEPALGALDLAGLNPDMATLQRNLAALRPVLQKILREKHGIKLLAVYVYPAQVVFCKRPFAGLQDLQGRRIRVSSPSQADLMGALGAVPVLVGFSQIMAHMQSGNTECAITGTMSGNTIGLHEVTHYIHTLPISWGLAMFGANVNAWNALPPDLQGILEREIPKLESRIWADSEHETAQGLACNRGDATCISGHKGHMKEIAMTPEDVQKMQDLLHTVIIPRWLQRCNQHCKGTWNHTLRAMSSASPTTSTAR